jgi:hypothetical protein
LDIIDDWKANRIYVWYIIFIHIFI